MFVSFKVFTNGLLPNGLHFSHMPYNLPLLSGLSQTFAMETAKWFDTNFCHGNC